VKELGGSYDPKGCFAHWTPEWKKVIQSRKEIALEHDWVDPRLTTRQNSLLQAIVEKRS